MTLAAKGKKGRSGTAAGKATGRTKASSARKTTSKKSTAKKPSAKKPSAKKKAAPKQAAAKKPVAKKATGKKATGKKATGKKAAPKKKASKPAAAKKSPAKKSPAKAAPAKAAPAKAAPAKKAPAKPAAPKKAAVRVSRASPKVRLPKILELLDKAFGTIVPPQTESVIEKAVYLVLREWGSSAAVAKAMDTLRSEFVDWNEVRVSSTSELARIMLGSSRPSSLRKLHPFALRLRDMIDQVYSDRNDTSFDFLLDLKPKDQIEFLEDLDDLGLHNAYALVQWIAGDDKLALVSSEAAQVAQKLGLVESAAVTRVRKDLGALAPNKDFISWQAHLNQLGEMEPDEWPSSLAEYTG